MIDQGMRPKIRILLIIVVIIAIVLCHIFHAPWYWWVILGLIAIGGMWERG